MRALPIQGATLPVIGNLAFGAQRKRPDGTPHIHRGIDLPRQEGTAVFAAGDGRVEHASAAWEQGFNRYGGHVVIAHPGGARTLYAHLSAVAVAPGQNVHAGDRIGAVGRTAFTKDDPTALTGGPHLHFEVSPRKYPQPSESARLDPVEWLAGAVDPRIASAITGAARETGLDLALLRAIAFVASSLNPAASGKRAGSGDAALGLFGLSPEQLQLCGVGDPFSPVSNAIAAAKVLRAAIERFGSQETALAAFVWGTPNVERAPSSRDWPPAIAAWVGRVIERYAAEQREGTPPPLAQRRAADGGRS